MVAREEERGAGKKDCCLYFVGDTWESDEATSDWLEAAGSLEPADARDDNEEVGEADRCNVDDASAADMI